MSAHTDFVGFDEAHVEETDTTQPTAPQTPAPAADPMAMMSQMMTQMAQMQMQMMQMMQAQTEELQALAQAPQAPAQVAPTETAAAPTTPTEAPAQAPAAQEVTEDPHVKESKKLQPCDIIQVSRFRQLPLHIIDEGSNILEVSPVVTASASRSNFRANA